MKKDEITKPDEKVLLIKDLDEYYKKGATIIVSAEKAAELCDVKKMKDRKGKRIKNNIPALRAEAQRKKDAAEN